MAVASNTVPSRQGALAWAGSGAPLEWQRAEPMQWGQVPPTGLSLPGGGVWRAQNLAQPR